MWEIQGWLIGHRGERFSPGKEGRGVAGSEAIVEEVTVDTPDTPKHSIIVSKMLLE